MRPAVLALLPLVLGCVNGPSDIPRLSAGTPGYKLLGRISLPMGSHTPTNCGPEALCGALNFLGIPVSIQEVESAVYNPAIQGSVAPQIVDFARRKGAKAEVTERGGLWRLEAHLDAGSPVMIEVTRGGLYHYYLIAGMSRTDRVVLAAYYNDRQHVLPFELLEELWGPRRHLMITFTVPPAEKLCQDGFDYLDGGKYELAEQCFKKALQLQPDFALAFAGLGRVRIHQNRLPEAKELLERALHGLPGDPEVLNNLADTILNLKGDAAQAEKHARAAVEGKLRQIDDFKAELETSPPGTRERVERDLRRAREESFYYHGTMAQALEADGKLKESIEARTRSLEFPHLEEDDPDAPARRHWEIAMTYLRMKKQDRAAEMHLRTAASLAKDAGFRNKIEAEVFKLSKP